MHSSQTIYSYSYSLLTYTVTLITDNNILFFYVKSHEDEHLVTNIHVANKNIPVTAVDNKSYCLFSNKICIYA